MSGVAGSCLVDLQDDLLENVLLKGTERAIQPEMVPQVDRLDCTKHAEQVGLECHFLVFIVEQADILVEIVGYTGLICSNGCGEKA